jgi:hypothetical protein
LSCRIVPRVKELRPAFVQAAQKHRFVTDFYNLAATRWTGSSQRGLPVSRIPAQS